MDVCNMGGGVHGFVVVIEKVFAGKLEKIPYTLRVSVTFILINLFWVLFRAESFLEAIKLYRGMINFRYIGLFDLKDIAFDSIINFPTIVDMIYIIGILIVLFIIIFRTKDSYTMLEEYRPTYKSVLIAIMLFCVSLIFISKESVFIYFNF